MSERGRVLDEKVVGHTAPAIANVRRYVAGAYYDVGEVVEGWSGTETVMEEKVFDPCGKWAPDSSNEAQFSQPPLSQEIDKIE